MFQFSERRLVRFAPEQSERFVPEPESSPSEDIEPQSNFLYEEQWEQLRLEEQFHKINNSASSNDVVDAISELRKYVKHLVIIKHAELDTFVQTLKKFEERLRGSANVSVITSFLEQVGVEQSLFLLEHPSNMITLVADKTEKKETTNFAQEKPVGHVWVSSNGAKYKKIASNQWIGAGIEANTILPDQNINNLVQWDIEKKLSEAKKRVQTTEKKEVKPALNIEDAAKMPVGTVWENPRGLQFKKTDRNKWELINRPGFQVVINDENITKLARSITKKEKITQFSPVAALETKITDFSKTLTNPEAQQHMAASAQYLRVEKANKEKFLAEMVNAYEREMEAMTNKNDKKELLTIHKKFVPLWTEIDKLNISDGKFPPWRESLSKAAGTVEKALADEMFRQGASEFKPLLEAIRKVLRSEWDKYRKNLK